MNIQEMLISQVCEQFEINPNDRDRQISVEQLKEIIRYTTNTMLMAHFQILLANYLEQHIDTKNPLHQLSVLAKITSENDTDAIENLSDFREIAKHIAQIEVRFLETSLGIRT
jgi:transcriptional antiterminator